METLQTFGVTNVANNQTLGYFSAKNKDEVKKVLEQKKTDVQNWVIEPKPYEFGILNWTMLDLALM